MTPTEVFDLIGDEIQRMTVLERRVLAGMIHRDESPAPPATQLEPMSDREYWEFELRMMEFGRHCGEQMRDIPRDYLAWLADQSRQTWRDLHRYLMRRRDEGDEE